MTVVVNYRKQITTSISLKSYLPVWHNNLKVNLTRQNYLKSYLKFHSDIKRLMNISIKNWLNYEEKTLPYYNSLILSYFQFFVMYNKKGFIHFSTPSVDTCHRYSSLHLPSLRYILLRLVLSTSCWYVLLTLPSHPPQIQCNVSQNDN